MGESECDGEEVRGCVAYSGAPGDPMSRNLRCLGNQPRRVLFDRTPPSRRRARSHRVLAQTPSFSSSSSSSSSSLPPAPRNQHQNTTEHERTGNKRSRERDTDDPQSSSSSSQSDDKTTGTNKRQRITERQDTPASVARTAPHRSQLPLHTPTTVPTSRYGRCCDYRPQNTDARMHSRRCTNLPPRHTPTHLSSTQAPSQHDNTNQATRQRGVLALVTKAIKGLLGYQ